MIREMEDTLVEIKASCAGVMAERKKAQRQLEDIETREKYWEDKAGLAVKKGRDDLAREALMEKRQLTERADALEEELIELNHLVDQYQDDIIQLEDRLRHTKTKERALVQRHIHARRKKQAQEEIRRIDSSDALFKFEQIENRIEQMEAEADLVNFGRKPVLEVEFDKMLADEDIEKELMKLKSSLKNKDENSLSV